MSNKSQIMEKEIALSIDLVKMMTEVPNALEYEENPEVIATQPKRLSRSEFNAKIRAEAEAKWREANTIEARLGKSEADMWRKFVANMPKDIKKGNEAKAERIYRREARKTIWTRAERRFFSHEQYCRKHGLQPQVRPITATPADVAHFPQVAFYLFS